MNNINLTPIVEAIIALLAALITYKLIPWIKAHTNAAQYANLMAVTKTLVFAAEQIYGANRGDEKFRYVKEQLLQRGYDVDTDAIEAAVAQYFNYTPELTLVEGTDDAPADN